MGNTFKTKNRVLFFSLLVAISGCMAIASVLVYTQQKSRMYAQMENQIQTKMDLIGAVLVDALIRKNYAEGQEILQIWLDKHPEIASLKVTLDNRYMFFDSDAEITNDNFIQLEKRYDYGNRHFYILMAESLSVVQDSLKHLSIELSFFTAFIIFLISIFLWFILFRWMINPMEQEIQRRTREIQFAKANLERQVTERTASLTHEVQTRKKAEASLRQLVRVVEQSPILVFITDTNGRIEYVNPKFEEITGFRADEAIGQYPSIIKSSDTSPEIHNDLWQTILSGHEWKSELKDRRKDGSEFWARVHISPVRDRYGNIMNFAAHHEDITEQKNAEIATEKARMAAELSNKAKTELLANMSHEFEHSPECHYRLFRNHAAGAFWPSG